MKLKSRLRCRVPATIHFHILFLDGVYINNKHGNSRFRWVKAPTSDQLTQLTHTIAHRVARYLQRQGLLVCDGENSFLTAEGVAADNETPMNQLLGSSITYRIAMGPQQGRGSFETCNECGGEVKIIASKLAAPSWTQHDIFRLVGLNWIAIELFQGLIPPWVADFCAMLE